MSTEFVLVPRKPTAEMLREAWADAQNEDAAGVWETMIAAYEGTLKPFRLENYWPTNSENSSSGS